MSDETSQTEWSGAPLTNVEIHDIREGIRMCALNGDIKNWSILLEQLNHVLYGFENREEQTSIRNQLTELNDLINIHLNNKHRKGIGTPSNIMFKLNDIYYQLDLIFHKSGLQTYIKEDPGDAF